MTTEELRAPFPASETGQLPKGGTTLDYVGHGAVTARMLDVDPEWNWEPFALDEQGLPRIVTAVDEKGRARRLLWIWLTIGGIRRIGVGSCPLNQDDAEKVLIGDALRNAGMRFGIALDLWIKGSPDAPQEPDRPVYMSALNTSAFLAKCAEAGAGPGDIDTIVLRATGARTSDPNLVLADEVTVLRAAFESWQAEHQKVAPPAKPNWQPVPTTPVGETPEALKGHSDSGKRVAKGVGPSTEGVTDLKVPSEVV